MFFQKEIETMPRQKIEELQLERLKHLVKYCMDNIPFYNKRLYGFVRDLGSSTPDHIGVVYLIQISNCHRDKIEVKETNSLDGQWMTKRDLVDHYDDFESWARLLISDIVVSIREKGAGTFKWKE